tara:strand:+ start:291 stop:530 length:240 start_codon:yes stop_codon:yes gene_type:complete
MTYRNPLTHWPTDAKLVLRLHDFSKPLARSEREIAADYIMDLHRTLSEAQRMLIDTQIERDRLLLENTFLTRQLQENEE